MFCFVSLKYYAAHLAGHCPTIELTLRIELRKGEHRTDYPPAWLNVDSIKISFSPTKPLLEVGQLLVIYPMKTMVVIS